MPARRPSPFCLQPAPASHTRRGRLARRVPARGEPRPRSACRPRRQAPEPRGADLSLPPLRGPAERGAARAAASPARAGGPRRREGAAPAAPTPPSPASSSCRHWLKVCSCRSFISPLVRRNLEMKPTAAAISRIMLARVYRAGCMEAAAGGSQLSGAAGAGAGRVGTERGASGAGRDGGGAALTGHGAGGGAQITSRGRQPPPPLPTAGGRRQLRRPRQRSPHFLRRGAKGAARPPPLLIASADRKWRQCAGGAPPPIRRSHHRDGMEGRDQPGGVT